LIESTEYGAYETMELMRLWNLWDYGAYENMERTRIQNQFLLMFA